MKLKWIFMWVSLVLVSGQALAQERVWSLDAAGEDAFLVYGVPESEDVGISFWCKIGTDKTSLYFPVTWTTLKNEDVVPVAVKLGDVDFNLDGKVTAGEAFEGNSIEANIPFGQLFFDAVKAADRIKLTVIGHKSVYPLADVQVDGLLSLCQQSAAAQ